MRINKSGFTLVEALLILIAIIGISFGGYYVYSQNKDDDSSTQQQASDKTDVKTDNNGKTSYTDDLAGYSLEYPENWTLVTSKKDAGHNDGTEVSTTVLTADTGLALTFGHNFGGRGGSCDPDPEDTPFAVGNSCGTRQTILAEQTGNTVLGADYNVDPQSPDRYKDYNIALVRIKYSTAGEEASPTYFSGLSNDDYRGPVSITDPSMGAFLSFSLLEHYSSANSNAGFYVDTRMSPQGSSLDFFNQKDVQEAEQILGSFTFNN